MVSRRHASAASASSSWSGKLKALPLWPDVGRKDKGKARESFEVLDGIETIGHDSDEPLDGEEGEVIYDEACFVGDLEGKIGSPVHFLLVGHEPT